MQEFHKLWTGGECYECYMRYLRLTLLVILCCIIDLYFWMFRLFEQVITRLLRQAQLTNTSRSAIAQQILNKYTFDITYNKLSRLPTSEIKTILKIPCPLVQSEVSQKQNQIAVFKRLRSHFNVQQQLVCHKCPRSLICPFSSKKLQQLDFKPQVGNKAALHDLFYFFISLKAQKSSDLSQLRWSAAYKCALSLQILLKQINNVSSESFAFRQVLRQLQDDQSRVLKRRGGQKRDYMVGVGERRIILQARAKLT